MILTPLVFLKYDIEHTLFLNETLFNNSLIPKISVDQRLTFNIM